VISCPLVHGNKAEWNSCLVPHIASRSLTGSSHSQQGRELDACVCRIYIHLPVYEAHTYIYMMCIYIYTSYIYTSYIYIIHTYKHTYIYTYLYVCRKKHIQRNLQSLWPLGVSKPSVVVLDSVFNLQKLIYRCPKCTRILTLRGYSHRNLCQSPNNLTVI
jgi:hypothetical protein